MIALIGAVVVATVTTAAAQAEECRTRPDEPRSAIAAKDALRWARAEATATDADSALTRIMTIAPVDAEGRSTGWMLELASPKRLQIVRFNAGVMTCETLALEQPLVTTPVNVSAGTILDLARLVKIAREASKADNRRIRVSASLQQNADDSAARWTISFVDEQGYPKGQVTIDSMTGAVVGKTPP
jgi:hypothetical protein